MTTVDDIRLFNLRTVIEPDGNLVSVESNRDIPFIIKRMFYVFGVHNQNDRGKHSHYKTEQVLISINGSIDVLCDDGNNKVTYHLKEKNNALYLPEMIWDEITFHNENSVLLSIASTYYNKSDYITDYEEFKKLKNENNKNGRK